VLPERRARAKPVKAKPEEGVSYILQAGSFAGFEEADQMKARLALAGLVAHIQKIIIEGKGEYHRVRLGPYEKIEQLDATAIQLQKMGIKAIRLKVKKGEAG
jgi:cell division protein FtsN